MTTAKYILDDRIEAILKSDYTGEVKLGELRQLKNIRLLVDVIYDGIQLPGDLHCTPLEKVTVPQLVDWVNAQNYPLNNSSAKNQRILSKLVDRMVVTNVYEMIEFLREKDPDKFLEYFNGYDYEEAATQEGWERLADDDAARNDYNEFFRKNPDYDPSELEDLAEEAAIEAGWGRVENAAGSDLNEIVRVRGISPAAITGITIINPQDATFSRANTWTDLCIEKNITVDYDQMPLMYSEAESWEDLCQEENIDYLEYRHEVYEYWAVDSAYVSDLTDRGEMVEEILGFHVWGRQCTGQAIKLDCVILDIAKGMEILEGQRHDWSKDSDF